MPLALNLQPINYDAMLGDFDLGAALQKGYQEAEAQKLARAQIARQLKQQADLDAARQAAIRNPSIESFNTLMVLDPQNHEAISAAWKAKDADTQKTELAEMSAIRGYLRAGKPEQATALLQRRIDADKKAGLDTADDEEVLSIIGEDPEAAGGLVDYMIAATIGPEKWAESFGKIGEEQRAEAKLPSEIAENVATATNSQASAAKTLQEAAQVAPNAQAERGLKAAQAQRMRDQTALEADRLALDRDTLESNVSLKLEELAGKGTQISPSSEKSMTDAVIASEGSRQLANRASALADKIATANLSGGWMSWLAQNGGTALGSPNLLRKEYAAIINSQAVKNLPPGPASDKDIALALKGFPPPTANADTMAAFLRGMSKLQTVAANREQARADWISENGNLGKAKKDIVVNGVRVPAGSNWAEFSTTQAAIERREAVASDRSYMRFGQ